ncbi:hypothetical protein JXO52_10995 [bacterium]|nr:hypothetical protein [bacterium]
MFPRELFPPSPPCSCGICLGYCRRPGWWSVEEAAAALEAGYGTRMMCELSPEFTFGVLSPAFRGNEADLSFQVNAGNGCTFLKENLCELYGTGYQPLECRFCHHSRTGRGRQCHVALEKDWHSMAGQRLVLRWMHTHSIFEKYGLTPGSSRAP